MAEAGTDAWDSVAWASAWVGDAGPAIDTTAPFVTDGRVEVDEVSLIAAVDPRLTAAAVEERLRPHDLTLGLFPERFATAPIAWLLRDDDPGAGGSGPGFASLRVGEEDGLILLGACRRPQAQAGRGLVVRSFQEGIESLRHLAQDATAPAIAMVSDTAAAGLWLRVLGDPDHASEAISPGAGLMILISTGGRGAAAAALQQAVDAVSPIITHDLGQNTARAFAAGRYELARHAHDLAGHGYLLTRSVTRFRWSRRGDALATTSSADVIGCEVCGATGHTAVVIVRRLAATSALALRSPP